MTIGNEEGILLQTFSVNFWRTDPLFFLYFLYIEIEPFLILQHNGTTVIDAFDIEPVV